MYLLYMFFFQYIFFYYNSSFQFIRKVQNYRRISFLKTVAKLFTALLTKKIVEWISYNNILRESQAGFRKGYSTVGLIYTMMGSDELLIMTGRRKKMLLIVVVNL